MTPLETTIDLESQISTEIRKDNGSTVTFNYNYTPFKTITSVKVFTVNPVTKEFFLLHSATAETQQQALEAILNYVKTHKNDMSSYTVRWSRKTDGVSYVSHFCSKDIIELIAKFFDGKDPYLYTIYEIKLNPVA